MSKGYDIQEKDISDCRNRYVLVELLNRIERLEKEIIKNDN